MVTEPNLSAIDLTELQRSAQDTLIYEVAEPSEELMSAVFRELSLGTRFLIPLLCPCPGSSEGPEQPG